MSFFGKIMSRYLNLSVLLGFSSKIFRRELGEEQSSLHKICKLSSKAWLYTSSTSFSVAYASGR
uniref:Aldo/keto reductase n=1 Tax=Solanum tuberosum TaxID=4113 RepID=M1A7Q5_SOLTU